jgi:hypothetical protein
MQGGRRPDHYTWFPPFFIFALRESVAKSLYSHGLLTFLERIYSDFHQILMLIACLLSVSTMGTTQKDEIGHGNRDNSQATQHMNSSLQSK